MPATVTLTADIYTLSPPERPPVHRQALIELMCGTCRQPIKDKLEAREQCGIWITYCPECAAK